MRNTNTNPLCISIFTNGSTTTNSNSFTSQWVKMINSIEHAQNNLTTLIGDLR